MPWGEKGNIPTLQAQVKAAVSKGQVESKVICPWGRGRPFLSPLGALPCVTSNGIYSWRRSRAPGGVKEAKKSLLPCGERRILGSRMPDAKQRSGPSGGWRRNNLPANSRPPQMQGKVWGHLLLNCNLAYPNLIILLPESALQIECGPNLGKKYQLCISLWNTGKCGYFSNGSGAGTSVVHIFVFCPHFYDPITDLVFWLPRKMF